jgi:sugar phosphate isomerase/epimerase
MWKTSFVSTLRPRDSFRDLAAFARQTGADGVDLRLGAGHSHGLDLPLSRIDFADVRALAEEIPVANLGSPLRVGTPSAGAAAEYLELAARVGCPGVRAFIDNRAAGEEEEQWHDRVASSFETLAECLGEGLSRLWFENHGHTSSLALLTKLMGAWPFGCVWDLAHSAEAGEAYAEGPPILGARLRHVHIKDQRREPLTGHMEQTPLFEGELGLEGALDELRATGFEGCVALEMKSDPGNQSLMRLIRKRNETLLSCGATA